MVVAVLKPESVRKEPLYDIMYSAIELIGGLNLSRGDKVIIKPNLCRILPAHSGATTDPRIVEAIVRIILKEVGNCEIFVVESDSMTRDADAAFKKLGYTKLKKYGATLTNLSKEETSLVYLPDGRFFKKIRVPKTLGQFDYFISVGKLKTHRFERISCILKNQLGCIPGRDKSKFHPYLSETLYDLNEFYKPNICVVDGLVAMEGFGPDHGTPRQVNTIICGDNAVETDIEAALIMGFEPKTVPHLRYAIKNSSWKGKLVLAPGSEVERINFHFIPEYHYLWCRWHNTTLDRLGRKSSQNIVYRGLRKTSRIIGRFMWA